MPEIGLDVGSRTIKSLLLKKQRGKFVLENYLFYDLAEGSPDFPSVRGLNETLKGLVETAGFAHYSVAGCLDSTDAAIIDLTLPKMPAADLVEAIKGEFEERINVPLDEVSMSYVTARGESNTIMVKIFFSPLKKVSALAEMFTYAALKPSSIDVAMLANIAMLDCNGYLSSTGFVAVLDLGEAKSTMALVQGKSLRLSNPIPTALGSVNSRIRAAQPMSYLQAEKLKTHYTRKHDEGESAAQTIVDGVYLELLQNLQTTLEYFRVVTQDQPIEKILILGGGAQYSFIVSTIEMACGVEAVAVNPFRNIEILSRQDSGHEFIGPIAPHMGTAVGLALRKLNGH